VMPMAYQDTVLEALAIARITRLITTDRVPFGPLRTRLMSVAWQREQRRPKQEDTVRPVEPYTVELLTCPWCMSVWVALAVLLVLRHIPGWKFLARVLAASYVTGFLAER